MIHHVFANRTNIGDLLAARGIQRLLAPLPIVEHLCDTPFVPETLAALAKLDQSDLVVIGGGGLFMDYFMPFWSGFAGLAPRLRYCLWGVGYCDLKREHSRPETGLIRRIAAASALNALRDALTMRITGVDGEPVPCSSVCAVAEEPPGRGVLHVDNYTTAGADVFDSMQTACERYAALTERPLRRTNNRIRDSAEALEDTLSRYRAADVVVSSALHGCVIALAMGRRTVAVSGDWKIESFMQMAGMDDWVLDIGEVSKLGDLLQRMERQPDARAFLEMARRRNEHVAARVRALATSEARNTTGAV
ncbi:MAG TPA: polysaccharide pyruvyl transferase family protein [Burkholderiales bacterium]|nr:polysaccharide pyruvyl transferase family protein [Burkholderiales bacterium]